MAPPMEADAQRLLNLYLEEGAERMQKEFEQICKRLALWESIVLRDRFQLILSQRQNNSVYRNSQ
jgi:hypothetical protein